MQGGLAVLDCQTMERFLAVHFQTGAEPIVGDLVQNQMAFNASGRIWIPRLAKFSVAVNPMILGYLKRMTERE